MRPLSIATNLAALIAALVGPLTAQGAITQTTIVSPPHGFSTTITGTDHFGPPFTVTGTSDGVTGDQVHLYCYYRVNDPADIEDLGTAPVGDGGTWSLMVGGPSSNGRFPYSGCTLHAIPEGSTAPTTAAGLVNYPGPGIVVSRQQLFSDRGLLHDFFVSRVGSAGFVDVLSLSSCGLCDMALYDPSTFTRGRYLFYGNGAVYATEGGEFGSNRAYLQVDGHNAFGTSAVSSLTGPQGGGQAAEITFGQDPAVTETERILRCTNDTPFPPADREQCGPFVDTGLRFVGTARILNGGRTAVLRHTWSATDGGTHAVDLHYDQDQTTSASPTMPQYQLAWISGDFITPSGDAFAGPSVPVPASILVRSSSATPNGSFDDPVGAITFAPPPSLIRFANTNPRDFVAGYRFQVAPGASVVLTQRYDISDSFDTLQAAAAEARDELDSPSIVILSPAEGATANGRVHVTGTAADSERFVSVTVNGDDVVVMPDGMWAVDLVLAGGPNTITAVATDGAGNTATATRRITVAPVAADTTAPEVTTGDIGSKVKRKTLLRSGLTVEIGCSEACSVLGQLLRSVKRRAGQRRIVTDAVVATSTLDLGTGRRTLTLKPTGKVGRMVRRGTVLKVSLTATDAALNTTTSTRTIRVR